MTQLSLKYIDKALQRGETEEQIKRFLKVQGIDEKEITDAFNELRMKKNFLASNVASSVLQSQPQPIKSTAGAGQATAGAGQATAGAGQAGPAQSRPVWTEAPKPFTASVEQATAGAGQATAGAGQTEPKPVGPPRPSPERPAYSPIPKPVVLPDSRIQQAPPKSNKAWMILVPILVIILGGGFAGYYYFDEIKNAGVILYEDLFGQQRECLGEGCSTGVISPDLPVAPAPVVPTPPSVPATPTPPPAEPEPLTPAELISAGQTFLAEQFAINGVYPETYEISGDANSFYCYRQNGAHYILGTTLGVGDTNLSSDLDRDYYCGETIKKCADPVYCVGPDQNKIVAKKQKSDCGLSKSLLNNVLNEIEPEKDEALTCLGRNILNNCDESKAVLETFNAGNINFLVEGNDGGKCNVKMEYGDEFQIPLAEQKQYANSYIACPVDINLIKNQTPEKDPAKEPGAFALSVYIYAGFESMSPDTRCVSGLLK